MEPDRTAMQDQILAAAAETEEMHRNLAGYAASIQPEGADTWAYEHIAKSVGREYGQDCPHLAGPQPLWTIMPWGGDENPSFMCTDCVRVIVEEVLGSDDRPECAQCGDKMVEEPIVQVADPIGVVTVIRLICAKHLDDA